MFTVLENDGRFVARLVVIINEFNVPRGIGNPQVIFKAIAVGVGAGVSKIFTFVYVDDSD